MRLPMVLSFLSLFCAAAHAQEFSTATMRAIDLKEAFALSLKTSETLAQQQQGVLSLEAAEKIVRSAFRPNASLGGYQTWQDKADASVSNSQTSKTQAAATVSYNAFSGMRDYLSARSAKSQTEAAKLSLLRAKQNFYQSVADAYYSLLSMQEQIAVRAQQLTVTRDRIKELNQRERIGRSRKSEVLAAEAQLAQDQASLQSTLGEERSAQHTLQFLTGLDSDLAPRAAALPVLKKDNDYLSRADTRADVASLRRQADAARDLIDIQRGLRLPTLDLAGNYYFKRPSSYSGINWDFTATVAIPLYTGGQIQAKVEQAAAQASSADLALKYALRQARTEISQSYDDLKYSLATAAALDKALDFAQKNAQSQITDYRYGLVTNIDVLTALSSVLQIRLQQEQAYTTARTQAVALAVSAGGPADILQEQK